MKKLFFILIPIIGAGAFWYFYNKRPDAKIQTNADGSGSASLGSKTATFKAGEGIHLQLWNGFSLDASSADYTFRKGTKVYGQGKLLKGQSISM